ncbi:hypothetical protein [Neisseria sp.]|uniref:hypothetical protein n=1 Tax=Neisseria sp. TaxID=192066 RepID=UPI00359FCDE0
MQQTSYKLSPAERKGVAAAAVVLVCSIAGLIYANMPQTPEPQAAAEKTEKNAAKPLSDGLTAKRAADKPVVPNEPLPVPAVAPETEKLYRQGMNHARANDWAAALPLLEQAAQAGHWKAQNNLGVAYLEGKNGVPRDDAKGCGLMIQAVTRYPDFHTADNVRMCLEEKPGIDGSGAAQALKPLAQAGYGTAQYALASLQLYGGGKVSDGLYWLGEAARREPAVMQQFAACFGQRTCSREFYDPAVAHSVQKVLRRGKPRSWWQKLTGSLFSDSDEKTQQTADEYVRRWQGLENHALAAAVMRETGLEKPSE